MTGKLLTVEDAADRLGTSARFVRRLIAERRIAYIKVGRQGRRRFGAIRRLPSGRYQVRYRTADGRHVTAPTTFEAKADAGRFLSKIETDMLRGEWADPRLGRTSFNEWADRWLDSTVNLRANTKDGYRSILRRYLRPAFGSYPLARIDVLAVRTWLAKLEAEGVGQATRAKAY
jgi:excisionase family DNA binding protein